MKMIKKITTMCAAIAIGCTVSMAAFADGEDYTREQIINEYWTNYWGNSLPGEENPEGSLEYHILETWLDTQYGHTKYEDEEIYTVRDWSSKWEIRNAWNDYYEEYTKYWHMNDDSETGEFTIEEFDPEEGESGDVLYTFEFLDGKWNMIDVNGNTVDTFDPHGGDGSWEELQKNEETKEITFRAKEYTPEDFTDETSRRVAVEGETAQEDGKPSGGKPAQTTAIPANTNTDQMSSSSTNAAQTASADSESNDKESSSLPYVVGGILIIGAGGAGGYFIGRKRNK